MAANASSTSIASQNSEKPFLSTSFPSSLPTPVGPISPSSSHPPTLPSTRLRSLNVLLHRSDRTLVHLTSLLSTPTGQDALLATLSYTLTFVHANLNSLLASQLQSLAQKIARDASTALLPGETVIASLPAPALASLLARTSASAKALADLAADFRVFVRLWGLLGVWSWGKGLLAAPPEDSVLRAVAWAQVGVNAVYQVLENLAYLGQHGVLRREEKRVNGDWMWSSRFWAAHVALEFLRLWRVRRLWDAEEGEGEKEQKIKKREMLDSWWRQLFVNVCYAPLTVHWGLEEGFLGERVVGLLGGMAGITRLRHAWKETA